MAAWEALDYSRQRYGLPHKRGGRYFYSKNTGLQNQNELQILQGAAATAALAFLAEAAWLLGLSLIERQPVEA